MIWPSVLVVATNLNTLHADDEGFTGGVSRYRFLIYCMSGAFAWYFLPGELDILGKAEYRLLVHCSFVLFLCVLDCTYQLRRQSALRRVDWIGVQYDHIRLESNHLDRFAIGHSMVG